MKPKKPVCHRSAGLGCKMRRPGTFAKWPTKNPCYDRLNGPLGEGVVQQPDKLGVDCPLI